MFGPEKKIILNFQVFHMHTSLLTDPKNIYVVPHMHFTASLFLLITDIAVNTHFPGKGGHSGIFLFISSELHGEFSLSILYHHVSLGLQGVFSLIDTYIYPIFTHLYHTMMNDIYFGE